MSIDIANGGGQSVSVDMAGKDDSARIDTASEGDGSARLHAGKMDNGCADCEGMGCMQA